MKKLFCLFLLLPVLAFAQESVMEKSLKAKVAMMQNFNKAGGEKGETMFWQTKGKVTFGIVNYTDEQNPQFRQLFVDQFHELLPIYQKMVVSEDERDTALFVKTLIRQEDDYRKLLTAAQLGLYRAKLTELETKDVKLSDSYASLFFSDALLKEYKDKFGYTAN